MRVKRECGNRLALPLAVPGALIRLAALAILLASCARPSPLIETSQVPEPKTPALRATEIVSTPTQAPESPAPSPLPPTATPASVPTQPAIPGERLVDDPAFVRLTALPNPGDRMWWATDFVLEVQAMDPDEPVVVSYLLTDPSGTPANPTASMETKGNDFVSSWEPGSQYYFYTQVGNQAQPAYAANPQYFPLPHYRTCLMVLGGRRSMYAVFLRENDAQITRVVLKGSPFQALDVPRLGSVTWQEQEGRFEVRSYGGPVEVGIWVNATYQHDEVAGWGKPEYAANPKHYYLDHPAGRPSLGLFLLMIARYDRLGLIIGNESESKVTAVALAGSHAWQQERVPNLAELTALIPRTPGAPAKVEVRAIGSSPVEVSHFGFDNSCWQWEVNGALPEYAPNPQSFALKHYTPAFLMVSRYGKAGIFLYNENDGQVGVLPVSLGGS